MRNQAWIDYCLDRDMRIDVDVWSTIRLYEMHFDVYVPSRGDGHNSGYKRLPDTEGSGWRGGYGLVNGNGYGDGMPYGNMNGGSVGSLELLCLV